MLCSCAMHLNRRRLLGLGLGGTVFVAIGGVGVALQGTVARAPSKPLWVLTERQFSVLAAIADTVCPAVQGLPAASELQVAEGVDAFVASLHPADGAELGMALLVVDNALPAALLDRRITPFTHLSPADRVVALDRWRTSRIPTRRKIYRAVTGLVMATYWADARVHDHMGYHGPPAHLLAARDALASLKAHPVEEQTDGG